MIKKIFLIKLNSFLDFKNEIGDEKHIIKPIIKIVHEKKKVDDGAIPVNKGIDDLKVLSNKINIPINAL